MKWKGKDITIKKVDGSFLRGVCIAEDDSGVTLIVRSSNRTVFVPFHQISEILTGGGSIE
jgi:hypothetical protein